VQKTAGVLEMLLSRNRLLLGAVLSVLLCFSLFISVDAEAEMWDQTYGSSTGREEAFSLIVTSDEGYALAGYASVDGGLVDTY
jgi:putative exporter of polyketide antibiotics